MEKDVFKTIVKLYHENKLSHAYLIETNNIDSCYNDLIKVIKQIECSIEFSDNCTKCNICNLIDNLYLPNLIVIDSMGSSIKKESIIELKHNFSTKPVITRDNIYIIKQAELLTGASANTLLKFLEEPEENIIGFLITNNINNVIDTIKSRCEVLKVIYDKNTLSIENINEYQVYVDIVVKYLEKVINDNDIKYNREIILSNYKEREDIKIIFRIILIIFQEYLNKLMNFSNLFDKLNVEYLKKIKSNDIIKIVNLVIQVIDDLESNANIELLLDRFMIEMGEVNG